MSNTAITLVASAQKLLPVAAVATAALSPAVIAVGALGCQLGTWDWRIGLIGAVMLGLVLAVIAGTISICALVACSMPPVSGRGLAVAALALLLAAMTTGRIAMIAALAAGLPPINDVRTSESLELFPDETPVDPVIISAGKWGGATRAEAQAAAYPHVAPLEVNMPATKTAALAERIARRMGWKLDPTRKLDDGTSYRFTARAVSRWYGFTDDIVVVIQKHNDNSIVEIRSASRVGNSDLGANARRIKTFLDDMLLASLRQHNR